MQLRSEQGRRKIELRNSVRAEITPQLHPQTETGKPISPRFVQHVIYNRVITRFEGGKDF